MLDLRRLRILHEFSRQGSIAGAAAALGYTPAAVSQQIGRLEREAGTPLLDRTARSAELTDSGRLLVQHAEQILAMVEAAESVLAEQTDAAVGEVSVTAFPTAAVAFAPALAHSLREHTAMRLILRQALKGTGVQKVSEGSSEIALIDDWSGRTPDTAAGKLRYYHLLRDPMVLVVPETHPMADQERPVDLRELAEESWLATPSGEPSRRATDTLLANVVGAPTTAWEFEGLGTILSLVARGIGIATVPSLALTAGTAGLGFRRLPGDAPVRDVYAVVRAARVRRPAVNVTLQAIHSAAHDINRTLSAELPVEPDPS
ncbi:LysR family transcriptional regulator [Lipingzhangella sp. LS1_29]|uniref:LysR family transcriptional regulator n=1 Tax=Lipingzhangella rawalii TaxID=2055835 RepID=A0ABU2H8Q7_9ACTN|nr:LysR family transcriptional regulator [Lipingzhangella rawalii]MDS1270979.1 LysR family transcriptional regulator [Lipingzhangella rawalii]